MELFLKACGVGLLSTILILAYGSQSKDISAVLLIAACAMTAMVAMEYLKPVMEFTRELEQIGNIDPSIMKILLKSVGIGLIGEIAALICSDGGSSSLGKTIQMMGSVVILWLSLPLFTVLLDMLRRILGEV